MANLKAKLALTKLRGAKVFNGKDGKPGLWIPIETAGLFQSAKTGEVYLDIDMREKRPEHKQWGEHDVRQSMTPEFKNQYLTELAAVDPNVKYIPNLGNTSIIVPKSEGAAQANVPPQVQQVAAAIGGATIQQDENIPF